METRERAYQVIWALHAQDSLNDVVAYIELDSAFHAERVRLEILKLGNSLFDNPYKFQECLELPAKNHIYRKATYAGAYKIIYKIVKNEIRVLEVFHGRRSPAALKRLRRIRA
jgi:plasmid stabilization system protein ParE